MEKLYIDYDHEVPQIVYTGCSKCSSLMGTSLCSVQDRGCCSYFPEFTLVDIQRMAYTSEGMTLLESIREMPSTIIYPFHIHVKGSFDSVGYEKYMKRGQLLGKDEINDQTVFFRTCPFVRPGSGCTLPPRFRTYVCNFFVCREVLGLPHLQQVLQPYFEERLRFVRWLDWEIAALKHILQEQKLNLVDNFDAALEVLRATPINTYDFPQLPLVLVDIPNNDGTSNPGKSAG